ncbi:LysM peptidoglycan-binding domain-containing protein [Microbacterium esteraromaticum]|uniref:muramidase family protein n=1 Tax=Microbacterium esteraromaticum TaxID=57043 RepID=UPI001C969684|nr:LysM peptidoglycan-binding domain-containing protein [Microbacterium esteraromaticum]MBY6062331.1 LysM peptidoglycan-binding domain-containing protein [Microbacterium esteraromaticum]
MTARTSHTAPLRFGAPAAVVGALAAALTVSPAHAQQNAPTSRTADLTALSLAAANPRPQAASPTPVATAVIPASARPTSHTVRAGDTVYAIAIRHGLRTADVLSWNGLNARSVIYPGQTLRLSPTAAAQQPPKTSAPQPVTQPGGTVHTVKRGDTVYAIAQKYRSSVSAIVSANGLGRSAVIYPGQKLRIGGTASAPSTPTTGAPNTGTPSTPSAAKTHRIVAGDTLYGIAKKYGTSVSVLLRANNLGSGAIIYPGQTLRLSAPPAPAANAQRYATLDATQKAHAAHIIRVGRELGISDRGIAIALATAMVESSMRNLDYGDRDSLGLFQQRPSQGWGTAAQILDADRSIRVFYGGPQDPNGRATRGLLDISGWQNMSFTGAAQAVQISAYPDRYGQWEQQSFRWLASL